LKATMKLALFFSLLVALPMAMAVTLEVAPVDTNAGDTVTFTVSGCNEGSATILRIYSPGDGHLIDIVQGNIESGVYTYNHLAGSETGVYEAKATCQNDADTANVNFCNGMACPSTEPVVVVQGTSVAPAAPPANTGGGGGSTYRSSSRSSVSSAPKECVPSWVCRSWTSCVSGKQSRECADEKQCGIDEGKPLLERGCTAVSQGSTFSGGRDNTQGFTNSKAAQLQQPSVEVAKEGSLLWLWIVIGIVLVAVVGTVVAVIIYKRKQNSLMTEVPV
jgi:hypothetical protein